MVDGSVKGANPNPPCQYALEYAEKTSCSDNCVICVRGICSPPCSFEIFALGFNHVRYENYS